MDLLSLVPDNITELLVKIVRFTELRRRVLHRNIRNVDRAEFIPEDLPVQEFSQLLHAAVAEHLQNQRLLFRDTLNIRFGPGGEMQVRPAVDRHAHRLLQNSPDEYMELQVNRLLENALNRKVAQELLRQTCGVCPVPARRDLDRIALDESPRKNPSARREQAE